jgi:hypothetical protein
MREIGVVVVVNDFVVRSKGKNGGKKDTLRLGLE